MASPRYLSPVKNRRLLWPSLSPQKSNLLEQLIRRPGTVPLPCSPPAFELPKNDRHFLLGTKIVSSPHWRRVKKVEIYLSHNYSILYVMQTSPMLILRCAKNPPVGSRPFLVAGLVWLSGWEQTPQNLPTCKLETSRMAIVMKSMPILRLIWCPFIYPAQGPWTTSEQTYLPTLNT